MNLLVTRQEREWIRDNATKEMGKTIKHKIVDLEKLVPHMREERKKHNLSPYVSIIPISASTNKTPNRAPTYQKDPVTGVYYGVAFDEDDFGNPKWQRIPMSDSLTLDLDNENDARIWAIIRFYPEIKGSPFQTQNPYYKVYDPVSEAKIEISETKEMQVAFKRIDSVKGEPKAMVSFARYLGEELMSNATYEIVEGILLRRARQNPIAFNKLWDSKQRAFGELLETARSLSIIIQDIDRGFVYENRTIGMTREEAINTLQSDTAISASVKGQINKKDLTLKSVINSINTVDKNSNEFTE